MLGTCQVTHGPSQECFTIPIGRFVVEEEDVISSSSYGDSSEVINGINRQFTSMDEMSLDVLSSSLNVRMKLFEEARNRKQQQGSTSTTTKNSESSSGGGWIPELSRLSGKVLDLIAMLSCGCVETLTFVKLVPSR